MFCSNWWNLCWGKYSTVQEGDMKGCVQQNLVCGAAVALEPGIINQLVST